MRQIREILRLKYQCQLSVREIGGSCGLPPSTVSDYLQRAKAAGIGWPLPEDVTEERLQEQLLVKETSSAPADEVRPLPDWKEVHQELKRRGVTLQLLWKEYRQTHPEGYGYSRYWELYQAWADTLDPVLRQVHLPGEKMFVDWAGQTVPIHNSRNGTVSEGHVFIGVLGFSNKIFAEAFPDEQLPSWIEAHCHAYTYMDGVPKITVPDYVPRHIIGIDGQADPAKLAVGVL